MGLVMISEGMLGEGVYTRTYSITANTTSLNGGTTLEKREKSIEGATCTLDCLQTGLGPNPDDCTNLYHGVYKKAIVNGQVIPYILPDRMSRFPSWFIRRVMAPD